MIVFICTLFLLAASTQSTDPIQSYTDDNGQIVYYNATPKINTPPLSPSIDKAPIPEKHLSKNVTPPTPPRQYSLPPDTYRNIQTPSLEPVKTLFGFTLFFFIFIVLTPFILLLIALIDILKNEFKNNNKLIWLLVVLFLPYIGPILYYFIGLNQKKLPNIPDEFQP